MESFVNPSKLMEVHESFEEVNGSGTEGWMNFIESNGVFKKLYESSNDDEKLHETFSYVKETLCNLVVRSTSNVQKTSWSQLLLDSIMSHVIKTVVFYHHH